VLPEVRGDGLRGPVAKRIDELRDARAARLTNQLAAK
jgi:hypothetical protein